jgi:hypothetical protein
MRPVQRTASSPLTSELIQPLSIYKTDESGLVLQDSLELVNLPDYYDIIPFLYNRHIPTRVQKK